MEQLNSLPVSGAILDSSGAIVAVNQAWKDFAHGNGLRTPDYGVGSDYLQYCEGDLSRSSGVAEQIRDLIAGRLDLLTLVYPCDSPTEKRSFILIGAPLSQEKPTAVALLHVNLTQMLPGQGPTRSIRVGMARTTKFPQASGPRLISESVEHSVVETLSSDLMEIFSGPPPAAQPASQNPPLESLSSRQMEILRLLGEGKSNAQIAAQLFRSPNTVKLHVSAILQRLNLKSRTQAALLAASLPRPQATA